MLLSFRWEKGGFILSKSDGFSLTEVLIASGILMVVITTLVPIITLLNTEKSILSDRRIIVNQLHDQLQPFLWDDSVNPPSFFTETIQYKLVTYNFTMRNEFIKGCVSWENAKKIKESICLYGIPQK